MQTDREKNRELFETMPVPKAVARMAVPTVIGQLIVLKTGLLPYRGDITLKKVNIKK